MNTKKEFINFVGCAALRFFGLAFLFLMAHVATGGHLSPFFQVGMFVFIFPAASFVFVARYFYIQSKNGFNNNENQNREVFIKVLWITNFAIFLISIVRMLAFITESPELIGLKLGGCLVALLVNTLFYLSLYLTPFAKTQSKNK